MIVNLSLSMNLHYLTVLKKIISISHFIVMMKKSIAYRMVWVCILLFVGGVSCKVAEKSAIDKRKKGDRGVKGDASEVSPVSDQLSQYRSALNDLYTSQRHDYPDIFQKTQFDKQDDGTDYRGYRIQLISTRNKSLSDSTEARFLRWLKNHPTSYRPKVYPFFRQPYYRVHVGDFQQRDHAIRYTRLLKSKFPGAWVVHDQIRPRHTPSDSVNITAIADTTSFSADSLQMPNDSLESPESDSPRR